MLNFLKAIVYKILLQSDSQLTWSACQRWLWKSRFFAGKPSQDNPKLPISSQAVLANWPVDDLPLKWYDQPEI